jgi:hypothetical protein
MSFVFFAPVNAIGQLCVQVRYPVTHPICNSTNSTLETPEYTELFNTSTTPAPTMSSDPSDEGCTSWETQWFNVWLFYSLSVVLVLQSIGGSW